MRRFFVSPHPTFGSYSAPVKWRVEASPYYWWWRALWHAQSNSTFEKPLSKTDEERRKRVLDDFGVLECGEDRYLSFCRWWTTKMPNGEERGVYLFAEPQLEATITELTAAERAAELVDDDRYVVVAIPKDLRLTYVKDTMDRVYKRHGIRKEGRDVRDPRHSRARYSMTKAVHASTLKTAFDLYEARLDAEKSGERVTNAELAKRIGLTYQSRKRDEVLNSAQRNRNIGIIVTRHLRAAKEFILAARFGRI